MDEIIKLRQQEQVNAALPFGWNPGSQRIDHASFSLIHRVNEFATWPEEVGRPMQVQATGELYFVPGISDPGGNDILR